MNAYDVDGESRQVVSRTPMAEWRLWIRARRPVAVGVSAGMGCIVAALPWLDVLCVPQALTGADAVNVGMNVMLLLVCEAAMVRGCVGVMPWCDAVADGSGRYEGMCAMALMAYAVGTPWLWLLSHDPRSALPVAVLHCCISVFGMAVVLMAVSMMGRGGGAVGLAMLIALVATGSLQRQWFGASLLPLDTDECGAARVALCLTMSMVAVVMAARSRLGARPLLVM